MDARGARHVLAHVVYADIHQLHGIQGASPEMGCCRRMSGPSGEVEIDLDAGEREIGLLTPVKAAGCHEIATSTSAEHAGAHHKALG